MTSARYSYTRAETITEAVATLEDDPSARLLAGGQSVLLRRDADTGEEPEVLVDLGGIDELTDIGLADNRLRIGAMVTMDELDRSALVRAERPDLADVAALVGDPQVRNRCTVGGSLAMAFPSGHVSTFAIAEDAELEVESAAGRRTLGLAGFFSGARRTVLGTADVIVALTLPRRAPHERARFAEFRPSAISPSIVNVALRPCADGLAIAAGGIADRPLRLTELERELTEDPSAAVGRTVAQALCQCSPPPLVQASPEYRLAVAEILLTRMTCSLLDR